jgi:hypothetical protein
MRNLDIAVKDNLKGSIDEISTDQLGLTHVQNVDPIIQEMFNVMKNDQSQGKNEVLHVKERNERGLVKAMLIKSNWLLDSGATVHVTNNKSLLTNTRKTKQFVKVGNGDDAEATYIGQVDMIVQEDKRLRLIDVLYVPGFDQSVKNR